MASSFEEPILFMRRLLRNPRQVGAVAPSSPQLSRLMAAHVKVGSGPVLEIGAGTGVITRELLNRGISPEELVVIERDPNLTAYLRQQFPDVRVRCGDAIHSARLLRAESIGGVNTVVSSLPLRNLSPADQEQTVLAMVQALRPNGQLIQFTYAAGCPIRANKLGLVAECLGRVWLNLPPAAVWRFKTRVAY